MAHVIELDRTAIDTIYQKNVVRVRDYPAGLARVLSALNSQIAENVRKEKYISRAYSRSKRRLLQSQCREYIDLCQREKDQILMCQEDMHALTGVFYETRDHLNCALIEYCQFHEESMASQKAKLVLRLKGFSKSIVDGLQSEESEPKGGTRESRINKSIFTLQSLGRDLVSGHVIPEIYQVAESFEYIQEPIILINMLQLLDTACSHSLKYADSNPKETTKFTNVVLYLSRTMASAFQQLRDRSLDIECIPLVLHLTLQSLISLLKMKWALDHFKKTSQSDLEGGAAEAAPSRPGSGVPRRPVSASDPRNVDYTKECVFLGGNWSGSYDIEQLALDLVLWTKVLVQVKAGKYNPAQLYCRYGEAFQSFFSTAELDPSVIETSDRDARELFEFLVLRELPAYISFGGVVVTNALLCVEYMLGVLSDISDKSLHPKVPAVSTAFGTIRHELVLAALALSRTCTSKYALAMGPAGTPHSVVVGDVQFFESVDQQCVGAFGCAATAFSLSLFEGDALQVLQDGFEICLTRSGSYNLMLAFMKLVLAACLCCLHEKSDNADRGSEYAYFLSKQNCPSYHPLLYRVIGKQAVVDTLVNHFVKVLSIMAVHRTSLRITHAGLLISRLLLRDSFVRKALFEDLLEAQLLVRMQPMVKDIFDFADGDDDDDDDNDDDEGSVGADKGATVTSPGSQAPESPLPDDAGAPDAGAMGTVVARFLEWKKENVMLTFNNGVVSKIDFAFTDLLAFLGKSHIQCLEVMEQWLLLVEHLGAFSRVCTYALVDSGVQVIVQRFLSLQRSNHYLIALAEICNDLLEQLYQ